MRSFFMVATAALAMIACTGEPDRAPPPAPPTLEGFWDAIHHARMRGAQYETVAEDDVRAIADRLLLLQRDHGGWDKNRDPTRILSDGDRAALEAEKSLPGFSFDNRNVYTQIEYLYAAADHLGDDKYREAAHRGLDLLLRTQMERCGGWPHSVPATNDYHHLLTIADEVMSGPLGMLRRAAEGQAPFADLPEEWRVRAEEGLRRGDDCLLRLQVRQGGQLTGWAGQYDPETLAPMGGRSFELTAIVSQETVEVLRYLMSIEDPSDAQIAAVEGAVSWLERSALPDARIEEVPFEEPVTYRYHIATHDRILVEEPGAGPLWARFYDVDDNSVILANRDGVRAATYADVHPERRTGYNWYGTWPEGLLDEEVPAWRARIGE